MNDLRVASGGTMKLMLTIVVTMLLPAPLAAQTAAAVGRDSVRGRYSLENCVNRFSMEKIESTKAGYQYWFVDRNFLDGRTIKMSVVRPGASTHPPHAHEEDEFFFVLEGKAEFFLNGEKTEAGPYTSLYCPSNVPHGIRNAGETELRYLVIKKYEWNIPRDTSFTTYSAWMSIRKDYPDAVPADARMSEGVGAEENLVYVSRSGRNLHCDIFRPVNRGADPLPAVLLLHGGGWRSGDKSQAAPMAQFLAGRGYAAVAIEYRLSGEARFPAAVLDVREAIRWVRVHAAERGIDPERIALVGTSAGGTLAALVAATGGSGEFEEAGEGRGTDIRVQGLVDIDGVLDMTDPAESGKDSDPSRPSAGARWFGSTFQENPAIWRKGSPLAHATAEMPPVLFINSSIGRFHAGRDRMAEKLKGWHVPCEIRTLPDAPHPFWLFHPWFEPTATFVAGFLDQTLKPGAR
jgi:acetyl esterase/lipase/mannose-6-phosphate isomerase-like protein (cupin superfamily)